MIASFRYETSPDPRSVQLRLMWDGNSRLARVKLPDDLTDDFASGDWPEVPEIMDLVSALPYAMFLSLKSETTLRLTGDISVWPERWGDVILAN